MRSLPLAALLPALALAACYGTRSSHGGGEAAFKPPRVVAPEDVAVPLGYAVEVIARDLTYPTGVAFDAAGRPHVVEAGYSYGESFTTPRLIRIEPTGSHTVVASGGRNGPWNGVVFADGAFYVAEGGQLEGGRILRISPDGQVRVLIESLPSVGDHHTNGPAIGPDGALYFGQGTATNSGIVGPDNAEFGWLARKPDFHDTPCRDVTLAGTNFESEDVRQPGDARRARVRTGAFQPFGTPTTPGQVVRGRLPCNGAILKMPLAGGPLELVAWGLRNPFGLAFAPDGRLYVSDNAYDDRGSRPVWGTGDVLWRIENGAWYGWPDFAEGRPLTEDEFHPPGQPEPGMLLARAPQPPPRPVARLGVHSSSNGFDFSRSAAFGHVGQAFIAQFGDQTPTTGKLLAPVGFKVVRVDVGSGVIEDFMINKGKHNGPASRLGTRGIERPVAARFDPAGQSLYVVDFGVMLMDDKGPRPQPGTGVLWRIVRSPAP